MSVVVEALDAPRYHEAIDGLATLLVDAIDSGAGVNFMAGVTAAEAGAWWLSRAEAVAAGAVVPFVARDAGHTIGSVLLMYSQIPNSPHRGEIGKVLVHRSARRRGLGRALMLAAEDRARSDGRWLLVLDTVTDSAADAFYRTLGWREVGVVPDFAMMPDGELAPATYFWKDLR